MSCRVWHNLLYIIFFVDISTKKSLVALDSGPNFVQRLAAGGTAGALAIAVFNPAEVACRKGITNTDDHHWEKGLKAEAEVKELKKESAKRNAQKEKANENEKNERERERERERAGTSVPGRRRARGRPCFPLAACKRERDKGGLPVAPSPGERKRSRRNTDIKKRKGVEEAEN